MRTILCTMLGLVCLVLGGCVETRFESPLGDHRETCDARWQGVWHDADARDTAPPTPAVAILRVDANCGFTMLDPPSEKGAGTPLLVPVETVHANGNDYLVIADRAIKTPFALKPPHAIEPLPQQSFFFARYRVRGNRIDLYPVDSERVAKLVIDGKLDGTVDQSAHELHVFVRGDRARMLAAVRNNAIFKTSPGLRLVRFADAAALPQHALQPSPAGQKK